LIDSFVHLFIYEIKKLFFSCNNKKRQRKREAIGYLSFWREFHWYRVGFEELLGISSIKLLLGL